MRKKSGRAILSYKQLGSRFVRNISHASRQEQWGRNMLGLAWTAGPVTFLALQAGYLLGFGVRPPDHLFYYFAGYTLVTGVVSIVTRFVYNSTRGKYLQEAEQSLQSVMGTLPALIGACRDISMDYYEVEYRPAISARYILSNPDAGSDAVMLAVQLLTGNKNLAEGARKSEVFRRQGLTTMCRAEADSVKKDLQQACINIGKLSPDIARILHDRMHGRVVSKRHGHPRTKGFIFRGLKSIENDDVNHINLVDVMEIATLVFELLAGREFPRIEIRYYGARNISQAAERLERLRRARRAAINRRNSRLFSAGELLRNRKSMKRFAAAVHTIYVPKTWTEEISAAVDEVINLLGKSPTQDEKSFARKVLARIRDLEKAENQVQRVEKELEQGRKEYDKALLRIEKKYGTKIYPEFFENNRPFLLRKQIGIGLEKASFSLNQQQQRALAIAIWPVLEKLEWNNLKTDDLLVAGRQLLQELDKIIPLYRWSIQSALEGSYAPDLTQLDPDLTSSTRIGWGISLVREIQPHYAEILHSVARSLVEYHGVRLQESAIEYLASNFGASPEYLASLSPQEEYESASSELQTSSATEHAIGEWPLYGKADQIMRLLSEAEKKSDVRKEKPAWFSGIRPKKI